MADHLEPSNVVVSRATPTSSEPSSEAKMISAAMKAWCETYPDFGDVVSPLKAKLYHRALADVPAPILAEALKRATQVSTRFPVPGDITAHVEAIRSERRSEQRRNEDCPLCGGSGWRAFVIRDGRRIQPPTGDQDDPRLPGDRSAAAPCSCRPSPEPELLRSPSTPLPGPPCGLTPLAAAALASTNLEASL